MFLVQGDKILIAVSGGQDSIYLINTLITLHKKWKWKLYIVHCEHQWSKTSKQQAFKMYKLSKQIKIPYYQSVSIKVVKKEEYARKWRYSILQYIAIYHNYNIITTAHNATDRIETFFLNLCRGSGINGLQALNWEKNIYMYPFITYTASISKIQQKTIIPYVINLNYLILNKQNRNLKLIRPLLDLTREEVYNNLFIEMPLFFDKTNSKTYLQRNRIRHRVIPYMRLYFNSKIDQAISKFSEIFYAENLYLYKIHRLLLYKLRINIRYIDNLIEYRCIYLNILLNLPIALQRRVLQSFVQNNINREISFDTTENIRLWCLHNILLNKTNISNHILIKDVKYSKVSIVLTSKIQLRIINHIFLCLFE